MFGCVLREPSHDLFVGIDGASAALLDAVEKLAILRNRIGGRGAGLLRLLLPDAGGFKELSSVIHGDHPFVNIPASYGLFPNGQVEFSLMTETPYLGIFP